MTPKDPETLDYFKAQHLAHYGRGCSKSFPEAKVAIGPSIENGFYYDFDIADYTLSFDDIPAIEEEMNRIIKEDQLFERRFA